MKVGLQAHFFVLRHSIMDTIIAAIKSVILNLLAETQFKLVDLEVAGSSKRRIIKVFLDSKDGITIDECRMMSESINTRLSFDPEFDFPFLLEVSSPGIGRPLSELWQFEKNIDRDLEIHYGEIGAEQHLTGKLLGVEEGVLQLAIGTKKRKKGPEMVRIPLQEVRIAKVKLQW